MSDELGTLRNVAFLAVGSEQRARLVEALAGEQEPIDAQAVPVLSSTLKSCADWRRANRRLSPEAVD
jgi:hypothetical protein